MCLHVHGPSRCHDNVAAAAPTPQPAPAASVVCLCLWRRLERFKVLRRLDLGCLGPDPAPLSRAAPLMAHLATLRRLQHLTLSKEALVVAG